MESETATLAFASGRYQDLAEMVELNPQPLPPVERLHVERLHAEQAGERIANGLLGALWTSRMLGGSMISVSELEPGDEICPPYRNIGDLIHPHPHGGGDGGPGDPPIMFDVRGVDQDVRLAYLFAIKLTLMTANPRLAGTEFVKDVLARVDENIDRAVRE